MSGSKDIKNALETVGIPVAYRQFIPLKDKPVPNPPFMVYIISPEDASGADGKNFLVKRHISVELYTDAKDTELEQKVEAVLNSTEWTKDEDYIESEALYMVAWEFDNFEKLG